jgi:hypothetical protein
MQVLRVSWNAETDDTKIKFTEEFKSSDLMVQLDVLSDMIGMLRSEYETRLKEWT